MRWSSVGVAAALSAAGCGKTNSTDAALRGNALPAVDAGPTVHLVGSTVTRAGAPLAGADVCPDGHPEIPCTKSDAQGKFSLDVPAEADVAASIVKMGYVSVLFPISTGKQDIDGIVVSLPAAGERLAMYSRFGAKVPDATTGYLNAFVGTSTSPLGAPGVSVSIEPASGRGPFYLADDGSPAVGAKETSRNSVALFANLAPGTVTVRMAAAGLRCSPTFGGWKTAAPNAVRVPIAPGFETHVAEACAQ
jgi:hypothetical protein